MYAVEGKGIKNELLRKLLRVTTPVSLFYV
jgi:hypothetical protein